MGCWKKLIAKIAPPTPGYHTERRGQTTASLADRKEITDEQKIELQKLYQDLLTVPFRQADWGCGTQSDVRVLHIGLQMAQIVEWKNASAQKLIDLVFDCAQRLQAVDRDHVLRALRALDGYGMEYTDRSAAPAARALMRAAGQRGDVDLATKCQSVLAQLGG